MRLGPLHAGVLLAALASGCGEEVVRPAACYSAHDDAVSGSSAKTRLSTDELCHRLAGACPAITSARPALSDAITVVPDREAMPRGVASQASHNNLDVIWHDGRLFFAFRTAPSHFASRDVVLYVVSTTDQREWVLEASFALSKDLREPRFLAVGGKLLLYFARLGEVTLTFKPEAMMVSEQRAGCDWSPPVELDAVGKEGFIPWRARTLDGTSYLIGYVGGENIYELEEGGLEVYWLKTEDGYRFEPVVPSQPVVLVGGSSETDFAFLDDGAVVAVSRNESGDDTGFGSKICRAEASALGDWRCASDPKKYDSPLVFRHRDRVYLIARRQVANDGNFDLMRDDIPPEDRGVAYQTEYWNTPKRCALWQVDGAALTVKHVLDLPSNGDTCFASVVPLSDRHYLVYNYTSPLDDPLLPWNDGQFGETFIYRLTLTLP